MDRFGTYSVGVILCAVFSQSKSYGIGDISQKPTHLIAGVKNTYMAGSTPGRWHAFYNATEGRAPRDILLEALKLFPRDYAGVAADIGFGTGNESLELVNRGWKVIAVDQEQEALDRLQKRSNASSLSLVKSSFEDLSLPPINLLHASYALPFCVPSKFKMMWTNIMGSLQNGGVFAGHLFGKNDEWNTNSSITFHNKKDVETLLDGFEVFKLVEAEGDRQTATGRSKYWHTFEVIAKKV